MATSKQQLVQEAAARFARMLSFRKTAVDTVWNDIHDYIAPEIGDGLTKSPTQQAQGGERKDTKILNNAPVRASKTLAAGMHSGLTNPSRPWFRLGVADPALAEYSAVRMWLDDVAKAMLSVFARSNTYNALHRLYNQLVNFGTGAALVMENAERVVHIEVLDAGTYSLSADKCGNVNALARVCPMTVAQLVEEFGLENLPLEVKNDRQQNLVDKIYEVKNLIEPHDDRFDIPEVKGRPWRSIYWLEVGADKAAGVLAIRGFNSRPILAPRWDLGACVYGSGPAKEALGDSQVLQRLESDYLKALAKVVEPPVIAPADMEGTPIRTFPGGVTYRDLSGGPQGQRALGPLYEIKPDLAALAGKIQTTEERIKATFYNNLILMLLSTPPGEAQRMTATEVTERSTEKMVILGPVLDRLFSDLLDPLIDRTFFLMWDAGRIPPPPQELAGMPLRVEYVSIMAAQQRAAGLGAIHQLVAFVGEVAKIDQRVLVKFDAVEAVEEYANMVGTPAKLILSDERVRAILDAQAKQQQQAESAQKMMLAAQGAKTLGQASLDPSTVLGKAAESLAAANGQTPQLPGAGQ
jgi:hypothetical protein